MKRLLVVIVLSITLLFSCTKPLDDIVILKVNDKSSNTAESSVGTTFAEFTDTTPNTSPNSTGLVTDDKEQPISTTDVAVQGDRVLIINKSSKRIHLSEDCSYAGKISAENKFLVAYAEMYTYLQSGYEICSYCEKHY